MEMKYLQELSDLQDKHLHSQNKVSNTFTTTKKANKTKKKRERENESLLLL